MPFSNQNNANSLHYDDNHSNNMKCNGQHQFNSNERSRYSRPHPPEDDIVDNKIDNNSNNSNDHNSNNDNNNNNNNNNNEIRRRYVIEVENLFKALQGFICLAKDLNENKPVIIKRIFKVFADEHKSMQGSPIPEDIKNEIRIMQYLTQMPDNKTRGFARLLNYWTDDEYYYLVLEHGGEDFWDFVARSHCIINKGNINKNNNINNKNKNKFNYDPNNPNYDELLYKRWKQLVQGYMQQILNTVCILHGEKIAHCDLSLENMVINQEHQIRIIDFGCALAKLLSTQEQSQNRNQNQIHNQNQTQNDNQNDNQNHNQNETNLFMEEIRKGKLSYMAPEVYDGFGHDTRKSDVFAVGIIFYMLLFGIPLYESPRNEDSCFIEWKYGQLDNILYQLCKTRLLTVQEYNLLCEMLAFNPNQRPFARDLLDHPYFKQKISNQETLFSYQNRQMAFMHRPPFMANINLNHNPNRNRNRNFHSNPLPNV